MLSIEARLSYVEQSQHQRTVVGWYLPCPNPTGWLHALREIGAQVRLTSFFLAPTSAIDPNAAGLIALNHPNDTSSKQTNLAITIPAGAIPLVCFVATQNKQLLLPIHARLYPASDSEIKQQLDTYACRVFVWLPQSGLIGFEPEDEIQPAFLIKPSSPFNRNLDWLTPVIPPQIPDRLPPISLTNSLDLQQLFTNEREQIGGDANRLMEIDEKGEPQNKGIPQKIRDVAIRMVAKISPTGKNKNQDARSKDANTSSQTNGKGVARSAPNGGSFLDNLSRYLNNFFNDSLQTERDRQIEKLLKLMATNPDLALKFSIPMGGNSEGGMARGIANPGVKLTQRDIDFSLRNVNAGGAAIDPWSIRDDLRRQLADSYREQARREIAAGRHRRAAYIYAHLLGDLNYAAVILEQGKYFTEAAALYGERLNRPRDQARCLIAAAQFEAAAAIYETLQDFVAAGDLWTKIDEPHRAANAYERAVDEALKKQDILEAAKLLDEKLKNRQRAEELLWQQWPYGQKSFDSMIVAFRWLAEQDRHTEALERFQTMVDLANNVEHRSNLARLCVHLYHNYPLQSLKQRAEDQCRVCIADGLETSTKQERENRMMILRSLHPSDQALQRDSKRYQDRTQRIEHRPTPPPVTKLVPLVELPPLTLPAATYIDAIMIGTETLAVGWRATQLIATRTPCNIGSVFSRQHAVFANASQDLARSAQLAYNQSHDAPRAFVSFLGNEIGFPPQSLNNSAGGVSWILFESPYPKMLKIAFSDQQQLWGLAADLKSISTFQNGNPITFNIHEAPDPSLENMGPIFLSQQVQIVCVGQTPFFSIGNRLFQVKNRAVRLLHTTTSPITHIAASLPHSLTRLLICTNDELCCWYADSEKLEVISSEKPYKEAVFLHGGRIAALTENKLELYERNQTGYRLYSSETLSIRSHCRLLPISVDAFGLLAVDGTLHRWRHR